MYCSTFTSHGGIGRVYAEEEGIVRVEIPDVTSTAGTRQDAQGDGRESCLTRDVAALLNRYFCGEAVDFAQIPVLFASAPPFRVQVLTEIRRIRYGELFSYGQVAVACAAPRAARAVGGALAANPMPIVIPCHRVVAANGQLTGFSAPGGTEAKKALLQMEGIEFTGMRVALNQLVMHRNEPGK